MNPGNLYYCRQLRIRLAGLLLLLMPLGLGQRGYAQGTDAPDSAVNSKPDDRKYSLTGTVVNSMTGEPIGRAAVVISGQVSRATLTDSSGHFEIGGLAEGRVFAEVSKPGFFNKQGTTDGQATLQVGPDASPVVLRMAPAGAIVGRVTDRDGEPIEGLLVHVIAAQNLGARQGWFDRQSQALTDENGDYRIANLPGAIYHVAVDQSQETTLSQPGIPNAREQGYAKVFYPGVSELSAAAPLELQAGQEATANFTLTAEPIFQVSGVVNSHEDPSALSFMRLAGESFDFTQNAPLQNGKFEVKLPAGSYSVRGFATNGRQLSTAGASVVIKSDSPNVHVVLLPPTSIPVAVQMERSGGATGHSGPLGPHGMPGMSLQLAPSVPSLYQTGAWWQPQSAEIQNVTPGVYKVVIDVAGPWWVKSVQCGNVDLLRDDLTVTAGVQLPSIEVTLRDDAATVSGTVGLSEQREQAMVLLVQPQGARNLVKAVTTTEGRFQFEGVAPGDYALLAFDNGDQLEYANPEVLDPYLSGAAYISLQPHGTASINLTLSPIGR
jgi:hypothetical protein